MVCQGEMVSKIKPVRMYWYRLFKEWDFDGMLSVILYQCEDGVPPSRKTSSVRKLGTLRCNLDVQYTDLPDFASKKGVMIKKLNYEVELIPSGASVEFVLYVDGRKQGSESTKIRYMY
jgi:hypothetical protein